MRLELAGRYASTDNPIVFIDESFQFDGPNPYYIVAAAMVDADQLVATRMALSEFYGTDAMHASEMYQRAELRSLDDAAHIASPTRTRQTAERSETCGGPSALAATSSRCTLDPLTNPYLLSPTSSPGRFGRSTLETRRAGSIPCASTRR